VTLGGVAGCGADRGHANYAINRQRKDPVGILRAQDDARVQDLVPIRYGRMSASAFALYRGSAAIMAYDLSSQKWTPGHTQLCGDAHLSNFGVFASPSVTCSSTSTISTRRCPARSGGRQAAGRLVRVGGPGSWVQGKEASTAVSAALQGYRAAISDLAHRGTLDVWYFKVDEQMLLNAIAQMGSQQVKGKGKKRRRS
jgi:hypothetical protein